MPTDKGKGKRKAVHPSERSPLLATSSRSIATDQHEDEPRRSSHSSRRARSIILTILIVLASLLISALLFLALLAYSFRPSPSELSALPKTSFKYTPPEEVKVLNVTEDGVLVNVTVRCGINADRAFGIERYDNDDEKAAASERGARGMGAEWWEDLRRWTARKALAQLPSRAVAVHVPEQILILPHHITSPPLLTVSIPSTLLVPLISDVSLSTLPDSTDWLQPISFTAIAKPLASTGQLWEFAQRVWAEGQARVVIEISKVEIELPAAGAWWGKYARREKEDLAMDIQMPGELTCLAILIPRSLPQSQAPSSSCRFEQLLMPVPIIPSCGMSGR